LPTFIEGEIDELIDPLLQRDLEDKLAEINP